MDYSTLMASHLLDLFHKVVAMLLQSRNFHKGCPLVPSQYKTLLALTGACNVYCPGAYYNNSS